MVTIRCVVSEVTSREQEPPWPWIHLIIFSYVELGEFLVVMKSPASDITQPAKIGFMEPFEYPFDWPLLEVFLLEYGFLSVLEEL
jgi:hypothetical protein